jgi:hypothetical protein
MGSRELVGHTVVAIGNDEQLGTAISRLVHTRISLDIAERTRKYLDQYSWSIHFLGLPEWEWFLALTTAMAAPPFVLAGVLAFRFRRLDLSGG